MFMEQACEIIILHPYGSAQLVLTDDASHHCHSIANRRMNERMS